MNRIPVVLALLCLSIAGPVRAEEDALSIIETAFEAAKANEAIARRYVFRERIVQRRFDKRGEEKKRESRTYDVTLLDTSEYRRLIAINDRPLYPKTAAREQRKLEKRIESMRNETPKQREKRLAKVDKGRKEFEEFLEEITKAFDFRRIGEEEIDGVATHVISFEPRHGYEPTSRETKILTKVHGTVWVSKDDHAWVQAEIETIENIRWAVIFKLREGARVRFSQRRINDEVWMIDHWRVRFRGGAALVLKFNAEWSGSYSDFQRFETDATVVPGAAAR